MIAKNKSSLLLTLGAAGLLISGGVIAYWILTQRSELPEALPVGANVIPQNALLTISVSTEPAQWQHLREFGTKTTQAELDRELVQLRDRFLTSNGYNYQQDIQPWVGKEVTLAFLPQPNPPTPNAAPPPMVMVLPIANPVRAKQLLENPKPLKQSKWIERTYKGVQIEQSQGLPDANYSATVLDGRFLVLADNPKTTEQAIDTYKGGASIAATPGYTQALGKIQASQPFAQLYLNIPAAAKFAAMNSGQTVFPQMTQIQDNQGLATTMTLESEGIGFKSISWLQPNSSQKHVVENKAGKMASRLPADTLTMLSGGDLQQLWQDYVLSSSSNPGVPTSPDNLRAGLNSLTGLDLDRNLLSWMGGEFSLSLIPSAPKAGDSDNFALALGLMVQTSDRSQAEKTFQQLDQIMSSRYQFQVQKTQVAGQPVVNWTAPYGTLTATHGWLDGDVAFLTVGAPVTDQIVPKPGTSLASTGQFQKTVPSAPSPNNGQIFLDVERLLKTFPLPQLSLEQQTFVEAIRSIGITTAVDDERTILYNMFVSLKKVNEPEPLPSPRMP
jgi:hypothetical protein